MDEATVTSTPRDAARWRRRWWKAALTALFLCLLVYATCIEPRWPAVERVEIRLARLPAAFDGFTIVHMSDFHHTRYTWPRKTEKAVRIANDLRPDLVVLTGDYVTRHAQDAVPCARILGGLRALEGVLAILGNHDRWRGPEVVADALADHGIRVLRNESVAVTRDAARLWIAGHEFAWSPHMDIHRAVAMLPRDEAAILLAHEPDLADIAAQYPIDLQLSGHSHGGQVRLPFLGAPVVPYLAEKYRYGLYRVGAMQLYVTRGVGVAGPPPLRFNCRPEITVITLRAGKMSP